MIRAEVPEGLRAPTSRRETAEAVRTAVRDVIERVPGYRAARPEVRRRAARAMVDVGLAAADLLAEDVQQTRRLRRAPLASAQAIGDTGREGAQVLRDLREGIDFPTYVQSLITGVFRAISNANVSQFENFAGLVEAVAASSSDFSRSVPDGEARTWAVQRFSPAVVLTEGALELSDDADPSAFVEEAGRALEAEGDELDGLLGGDLESSLLPLVKRKLARDRQGMLATMLQMGLQRVVVDEGRLHASMDLRVDTRAIQERQRQEREDIGVDASVSATGMGVGWGVQASVDTSYAKVRSDSQYSNEEIASQAGLRSSVDLAFRTEQVPLDRVADRTQRARIEAAAPTPIAVGESITSAPNRQPLTPIAHRDRPQRDSGPMQELIRTVAESRDEAAE